MLGSTHPIFTIYNAIPQYKFQAWEIQEKYLVVYFFDKLIEEHREKKWHVNFLKTWVSLEEKELKDMFNENETYDIGEGEYKTLKQVNWNNLFNHHYMDQVVENFFNHFMKNATITKFPNR